MGARENKVETYFKGRVKDALGGISRKWVSPGNDGVPDQIPMWINSPAKLYVEIKTIDGQYESSQQREHDRLRDVGAIVFTVWGREGVNAFIKAAQAGELQLLHHQCKREFR